ncbi:MAG: VOC family protein [Bryobacteraceae bacterium]
MPTSTLLPHIFYLDVAEAIAWLTKTFGFSEHYRYGEPVSGAQMHLGDAWFMLKRSRPGSATPAQLGYGTQSLTVFVEEVDTHFQRAKSSGARIIEDLHETVYGERQYGVEDLAGHCWLFSWHARDLSPDEWGATVSQPAILAPQISPMLAVGDGDAAIEFYKAAFDATVLWRLEGGGHVVAGLSVYGAEFFLAHESPSYGTRGPAAAGFTTVRIELFVDDPVAVHSRALAAGAVERGPVVEHKHSMTGPRPIGKMLQGGLVDPFGHMWLIGKILE